MKQAWLALALGLIAADPFSIVPKTRKGRAVEPSTAGSLALRFRSEVGSSAVTIARGSFCMLIQ